MTSITQVGGTSKSILRAGLRGRGWRGHGSYDRQARRARVTAASIRSSSGGGTPLCRLGPPSSASARFRWRRERILNSFIEPNHETPLPGSGGADPHFGGRSLSWPKPPINSAGVACGCGSCEDGLRLAGDKPDLRHLAFAHPVRFVTNDSGTAFSVMRRVWSLSTKPKRQSDDGCEGKSRRSMDSRHDRRIWRDSRLEIILSFVVVPIA